MNKINICVLDFSEEDLQAIQKEQFDIYAGTTGEKIIAKNSNTNNTFLLSAEYQFYNFPKNIQEYDVLIINLNNNKEINLSNITSEGKYSP
jgi:hypothetical protein